MENGLLHAEDVRIKRFTKHVATTLWSTRGQHPIETTCGIIKTRGVTAGKRLCRNGDHFRASRRRISAETPAIYRQRRANGGTGGKIKFHMCLIDF